MMASGFEAREALCITSIGPAGEGAHSDHHHGLSRRTAGTRGLRLNFPRCPGPEAFAAGKLHHLYMQPRYERRDPLAVPLILLAEQLDHITLLQLDSDQNVGCCHRRKQKVSHRHHWRCPECDDEAEI